MAARLNESARVQADQAESLRRRRSGRAPRIIHGVFRHSRSAIRLAHALHAQGWSTLLADTLGRLWPEAPARSLFGWREQIVRGQLLVLPEAFGAGWHAPGLRGDTPELASVVRGYDCVLLDVSPDVPGLTPGSVDTLVLELGESQASVLEGYALVKSAMARGLNGRVGLLGDDGACVRVAAACERFLGAGVASRIHNTADAADAFSALAVRMVGEETDRMARNKTGSI